jgi:hypothetical protein
MRDMIRNAAGVDPKDEPPANERKPMSAGGSGLQSTRTLVDIEEGFWEARESLQMVFQTSMSRMCSPWSVLAHTAARTLTRIPPHIHLPPLIGGVGSLNWFGAVVARSGGGKGASAAAARLLIPETLTERNAGSGEGIVAAFHCKPDDQSPDGVHEAVMFSIDEIDTLAAMTQRSASTTMAILRSGFSGETLGFSYAAREKRHHMLAHTYRMTVTVAVQPTRAGWLLADHGGGTPQRFQFFPGTDKRVSKNRPWEAGALTQPNLREWLYPREIKLPAETEELIVSERVKSQQGDQNALDGHALFCREKFAFALAVMDGRTEMTSEDWELAGVAMAVSDWTRESTIEEIRDAARIDALERGELRGIENAAAKAAQELEEAERLRTAVRWVVTKIGEAGPEGISHRDLARKSTRHTRRLLPSALQIAAMDGFIRQGEGTIWVKL